MKAYTYLDRIALDALVPVDHPDPSPGPHQIVLRMRAAALNFRDLAIVRGDYHVATRPPLVPLSDGAGEVVAIGSEVTRFRTGDLACPVYLPDWIDGPLRPAYTPAPCRLDRASMSYAPSQNHERSRLHENSVSKCVHPSKPRCA